MGILLLALLRSHPLSQYPGSISSYEFAVLDKHPIANLPELNFNGLLELQARDAFRFVRNYTVERTTFVTEVGDPTGSFDFLQPTTTTRIPTARVMSCFTT
jgi:hypothetical protein